MRALCGMGEQDGNVQTAMDESVASGQDIGLQVAVIERGVVVVDAVSGLANTRTAAPVSGDTMFWAGSTAKGLTSTVAHVLVERGALEYATRVAEAWPERAAHGKDTITLRVGREVGRTLAP